MFAYCGNNPVNLSDADGDTPYGPLNLFDYWVIHKMVQYYIVNSTGWKAEIFIRSTPNKRGKKRIGFLDIYNPDQNQYYEVKHKFAAEMDYTERQMEKYDQAEYIAGYPGKTNPERGVTAPCDNFSYGIYNVQYKLTKPGLIVYSITKKKALQAAYELATLPETRPYAAYTPVRSIIPFLCPVPCGAGGSAYDVAHKSAR